MTMIRVLATVALLGAGTLGFVSSPRGREDVALSARAKGAARQMRQKKGKTPSPVRIGDTVYVNAGDDKGKTGTVMRMDKTKGRVFIEGLNMKTKHEKAQAGNPGRIVQQEGPIHLSNVNLLDPDTNKPTRIYMNRDDKRNPIPMAKRSGKPVVGAEDKKKDKAADK